jgi:histone deacetylase 6
MQVLLGEGPNRASFVVSPSKEALSTVSQVLKIQQQFWPVLGPTYASLQAQQGSVSSNHSE